MSDFDGSWGRFLAVCRLGALRPPRESDFDGLGGPEEDAVPKASLGQVASTSPAPVDSTSPAGLVAPTSTADPAAAAAPAAPAPAAPAVSKSQDIAEL